jgi:hypothetical protein
MESASSDRWWHVTAAESNDEWRISQHVHCYAAHTGTNENFNMGHGEPRDVRAEGGTRKNSARRLGTGKLTQLANCTLV